MVPSFPLWLKVPLIPKLLPACAAWLASKVESSMFAMSPVPNVGVGMRKMMLFAARAALKLGCGRRSEEHTSELQSLTNLVCRLLLEKKKKKNMKYKI